MWGCVYRNLIGLVRGEGTEGVITAVGTFCYRRFHDVSLTVHLSITLVNNQLEAQIFEYIFYILLHLDDWLTVQHRTITLVDLQFDEQNSYLFICNTFIKILYMFRALTLLIFRRSMS
jgi:hypothetical protein